MKRTAWVFWAAVGLLFAWLAGATYVQNALDGELISAAKRLDGLAVKTCLARGANPNATDPQTRDPLWLRVLAHLDRRPTTAYDGDTALLVVLKSCVDRYNTEATNGPAGAPGPTSVDPTEIVSALLDKGANANVQYA
jgi:hypothetical protein